MSVQKQQRKAHFEVLDYPILDPPKQEYYTYDTYGNQVELSPDEACDLLNWLYQHRRSFLSFLLAVQSSDMGDNSISP